MPIEFTEGFLARYLTSGPRYTSYPPATEFRAAGPTTPGDGLAQATPLSVYVHVPFCRRLCLYCGCHKVISLNDAHGERYVDSLLREIDLRAPAWPAQGALRQMQWGGGTPTFLADCDIARIVERLRAHYQFDPGGEYGIEIDPRGLARGRLRTLAGLGFNRLSLGVQDLDVRVQQAIRRIQTADETFAAMDEARAAGFQSISLDLIYGLPRQTEKGFLATLESVLAARPDRLSLFHYAHLPTRFKYQRLINADELPSPEVKLRLFASAVARLEADGYVWIGMDHFARADDTLAQAANDGSLTRNFQGYTTHGECALLGLGVSAISETGSGYRQNLVRIDEYHRRIGEGRSPVARTLSLTADDQVRRRVIARLFCDLAIDYGAFEHETGVAFSSYFHREQSTLARLAGEGVIEWTASGLRVTRLGRFVIRNIAMAFDAYLDASGATTRFSRTL